MKKLYLIALILTSPVHTESLHQLALKFDTDKGPQWHNYTHTYEQYFSPKKTVAVNLLEIGLFKCASALMWESYFSNDQSRFVFVDIDKNFIEEGKKKLSARSTCLFLNQSHEDELVSFAKKYPNYFDIIIDDGSHMVQDQIKSFRFLFSCVKPGGIYIIEDLHCAYQKFFGGAGSQSDPCTGPNSSITFLKALVDDVNYIGACGGCGDIRKKATSLKTTYFQENISALHFHSSLVFIFKREKSL